MTTTEELTLRNTSPTLCAWPGDGKMAHEIPRAISATRDRRMVVVSSILRRGPTRAARLRPGVLRFQVALRLEGGHAAGARGRHGLAIGEVGDIAGREDAGHGRLGGARQHLDVVVRVEVDLSLEDRRVRKMPDRHEEPVDGRLPDHTALQILEPDGRDLALVGIEHLVHRGVPDELDLGILERALLHDLGGAEGTAPVDDLHLTSEPGEIQGLFHGGIASPHDHDVLVLEEEAVAGGAGRDAAPHELGLVGEPDQLGGGASGDDHGERLDRRVPGRDTEGASTEVDLRDVVADHLRAEALRLALEMLHEGRPVDAVDEAGIVLDERGQYELTAPLESREHEGGQIRAGGIDRRREAGRAGPDDDDLARRGHAFSYASSCLVVATAATHRG